MDILLKIARTGLLGGTLFLAVKPVTASAAAVTAPVIAIQNAMTTVSPAVTLQWKSNLSSPSWQTLGTFSGTTNLSFQNAPSVFVRGLCAESLVSATLAWPVSTDPTVTGYNVYYGTAPGTYTNSIDVGNVTTATLSNLVAGTRYYFAAKAYNSSRTESPYSNETNAAFQARFALAMSGFNRIGTTTSFSVAQILARAVAIPLPVSIVTRKITAGIANPVTLLIATNLASPTWQVLGTFSGTTNVSFTNLPAVFIRGYCTNLTTSVTLAWSPSSDPSVAGYKLYFGTASHDYTGSVDTGSSTTTTVSNLVAGATYYFAVTAYDSSGLQSPFSNEASGQFQVPFSLGIANP